jgi:hypothetical protein
MKDHHEVASRPPEGIKKMAPKKIWIRVLPRKERGLYELVKQKIQLPVNVMIGLLTAAKDVYELALRKRGLSVPTTKSRYKLMFNQLTEGSDVLELEPAASGQTELPGTTIYSDPAVDTFSGYFEKMNLEDETDAKTAIDQELLSPDEKALLFSQAYNLWTREEFDIEIITGFEKDTGQKSVLKERRRASIKRWRDIEHGRRETEIEGAITRLQLDGKPSYGILTVDGNMIKSELTPDDRDRIMDLIETPVRISGTIEGSVIKAISTMTQVDMKSYNSLGGFSFSKPLVLDFLYENNLFVLKNESLGIRAWGETLQKVEKNLSEDLQVLKEAFVDEDDAKLTFDARELKKRLADLLEVRNS